MQIDYHLNVLCRHVVSNLRARFAAQCRAQARPTAPAFALGALQQCERYNSEARGLCDALVALATHRRLHLRANGGVDDSAAFALLGGERQSDAVVHALRRLAKLDNSQNG